MSNSSVTPVTVAPCPAPRSFCPGISQVRILERVAISFSRVSSQTREDNTQNTLSFYVAKYDGILIKNDSMYSFHVRKGNNLLEKCNIMNSELCLSAVEIKARI